MKNAITFFLFNFFLIFSFFYNIFNEKKSTIKIYENLPNQKVSNFVYSVVSEGNIIEIKGKNLLKNGDTTFIEDLNGLYLENNNKIIFSAKEGYYKDTSNLILKNSAKIISDDNELISNELNYDIKTGKIFSNDKTYLKIDNIKIEGFNFQYDLNNKKFIAENIKGKI